MAYVRKTRDVFEIQVNYGYGDGWEYEIAEHSYNEARNRLAEYRENCPQYPARIRRAREPITTGEV